MVEEPTVHPQGPITRPRDLRKDQLVESEPFRLSCTMPRTWRREVTQTGGPAVLLLGGGSLRPEMRGRVLLRPPPRLPGSRTGGTTRCPATRRTSRIISPGDHSMVLSIRAIMLPAFHQWLLRQCTRASTPAWWLVPATALALQLPCSLDTLQCCRVTRRPLHTR